MEQRHRVGNLAGGMVGAVIGGTIGFFVFFWLSRQGLYAMILPGAMLGLGCGLASRIRSRPLGIGCLIAAVGLGVFTEWRFAPFLEDDGLGFFVQNLMELKPMTLIMIALGGLCAFWFGVGRERLTRPAER
jgi:hypothetical protein